MAAGDRWLAAFVVNEGDETVTDQYFDAIIERWDGTAWIQTGERTIRSCDDVLCVSTTAGVPGGLGLLRTPVELAPGDEVGPLWFDLADQEVGDYRLVVGSGGTTLAWERIDIVDEAPGMLALDQRRDRLVFGDALIEPGAEVPSRVTLLSPDGPSLASVDDPATIERWNGAEFEAMATVTRTEVTDADGVVGDGYNVTPLDAGAYRLATTRNGEPINGWFFVRDPNDQRDSPTDGLTETPGEPIGPGAVGLAPAPLTLRPSVAVAYEPGADRWRQMPSLPIIFGEGVPLVASQGGTVVVRRAGVLAVDAGDHWVPLPVDPWVDVETTVETTRGLVGFGSQGLGPAPIALDPDELIASSNRFQIGGYVVELTEPDQITGSELERTRGLGSGMTLDLATPTGPCTLATAFELFGGGVASPAFAPREVAPREVGVRLADGTPASPSPAMTRPRHFGWPRRQPNRLDRAVKRTGSLAEWRIVSSPWRVSETT